MNNALVFVRVLITVYCSLFLLAPCSLAAPSTPTINAPTSSDQGSSYTLGWTDESTSGATSYVVKTTPANSGEHAVTVNGDAAVAATTWGDHKFGTGSQFFNGSSDYIQYADSSNWDIYANTTDNWTIDTWVKFNSLPTGERQQIVSQYEDTNNYWHLATDGTALNITFKDAGTKYISDADEGGTLTPNVWHHIALVKNGTDVGGYIDGIQVIYKSVSHTASFDAELELGRYSTPSQYLNGYLDEFRIQKSNYFNASPSSNGFDKTGSGTPSASSYWNNESPYVPASAFDNSLGTEWQSSYLGGGQWLQYDLGSAQIVDSYSIGAHASESVVYLPKDWQLQGSNDESSWTTLDTVTNETGWSNGEIRTFTFSNTTAYRYYRIYVTDNNGGSTVGIAELNLMQGSMDTITVPTAPYTADANTKILEHFDSVKQFGTETCEFDGSGDYLSIPDSNDFNFGANPFTIEMWVKRNSEDREFLYAQFTDINNYVRIDIDENNDNVEFSTRLSGNYCIQLNTDTNTLTNDGMWHHLAVVRNGSTVSDWKIFIDGQSVAYTKKQGSYDCSLPNIASPLELGQSGADHMFFTGYLDDVCVSSVARWTSDFTPPSSPHTPDEHTKLYLSFDNYIADESRSTLTTTTGTTLAESNMPEGEYDYYVRAVDVNEESSAYSSPVKSITVAYPTPATPEFSSPTSGASPTDFTLRWGATNYAASYVVKKVDPSDPGHTVTPHGDVAVTSENVCEFGGSGDYLSIPDSDDWDVFASTTSNCTVDFYVRFSDLDSLGTLFSQSLENGYDYLFCYRLNDAFSMSYRDSTSSGFSGEVSKNCNLASDIWYHFVMVKKGTDVGIYLDGEQVYYNSQGKGVDIDAPFCIGRYAWNGGASTNYFNGDMKGFHIRNSNVFSANPVSGMSDSISVPSFSGLPTVNTKLLLPFYGNFDDDSTSTAFTTPATSLEQSDLPTGNVDYYVRAISAEGKSSSYSPKLELTINNTLDPFSVTDIDHDDNRFFATEQMDYTVTATGENVQYEFDLDSTTVQAYSTGNVLSFTPQDTDIGRHTITIKVKDDYNTEVTTERDLYVYRKPVGV